MLESGEYPESLVKAMNAMVRTWHTIMVHMNTIDF